MGEGRKMKRSLALFVAVFVASLVPGTAAAYLLSTELLAFIALVPAGNDFAVGEGKFSKTIRGEAEQFSVAAHGSPMDAKGHVRFNSASFGEARGEVDCLKVASNKAGIAGAFDDPPDEELPFFVVAVEDNGEPNGLTADRAVLVQSSEQPIDCGFSLVGFAAPIAQGNVVVKDR
jgi:hypothetical protein